MSMPAALLESVKRDPFKKAVTVSLVLHLFVIISFTLHDMMKPRQVVKKAYLFDMVNTRPQPRRFAAPPVAKPREVKKQEPAKKTVEKPKEKAISTKKAKKEEKQKEEPKEQLQDEPKETVQEKDAPQTLQNEMTISQPDFPFKYYYQQIINAVERNWNPPQELLGSEMQLAVEVKFRLLKNGQGTDLEISESSWNTILDKLALRAIEKARIPPIPGDESELTITYRLVLSRN